MNDNSHFIFYFMFFTYFNLFDEYVGRILIVFNKYPCVSLYFPFPMHLGMFMGLILTKGM